MKLRLNIVFSLVAHAALITTALAVGSGWNSPALSIPLTVSLVSGLTKIRALDGPDQKKQAVHGPVSPNRNAAVSGPRDNGDAVKEEITAEAGHEENHIVSPAAEENTAKRSAKESSGAQIVQAGFVQAGGPSLSSLSSGHQGASAGNAAAGVSSYDQAKTQVKSANTEDGRAIRNAIEKALIYPLFARKKGLEGTALTEFTVNAKGYPEDIRIIGSTGYSILDTAAKDSMVKAAPFAVAKGRYEIPITFRLKNN